MRIIDSTDEAAVSALASRDAARDRGVEQQAATIVADVRQRGDAALLEWTARLDARPARSSLTPIERSELRRAWSAVSRDERRALRLAASHLRRVAEKQLPREFTVRVAPGHWITQRVQPLERVGCYVPGGRHPLPSTLLMTVVPARVAGVDDIVVVCPRPTPVVLAAAFEAGATHVLPIGGAQAIGALAYGTQSIRRVDKIVGPGNAWVAAAKALVSSDCPIDLHAGPSEIVVRSDRARPEWIAADLIAQAEHDPAARAMLVTTRRTLAEQVSRFVDVQMPPQGPAAVSIAENGAIIVARTRREAVAIVNRLAPEHLVIDDDDRPELYRAAGTIFVGEWSVQAAGDYCTGSNHVLPTGGAARFRGGLGAADFVRVFSVQRLSARGLRAIAPSVIALAEAEGLTAHAQSVRLRVSTPARMRRAR
jgi:histidinol dehydrogenase